MNIANHDRSFPFVEFNRLNPSPRPASTAFPSRALIDLRQRLVSHIDADLSGVRLASLPGLPFDGLAYGDCIIVAEHLLSGCPVALLRTVTHELAHVFQQRAGRVRAAGKVNGFSFSTDLHLEAEAEAAADAVACGHRITFPADRSIDAPSPVLQPLISVGSLPRANEQDFTANFLRLIRLIPHGLEWLAWALRSPAPAYQFDDEATLLMGVQLGLHGHSTTPFQGAGLRLAPALLLGLSGADFSNVVSCLENGDLTPAAVAVFAESGVRTEAEFARVAACLAGLGVSSALALAHPSLSEQVLLYEQFVAAGFPATDKKGLAAASFATSVAQSASEFSAACSFYLSVAGDPGAAEGGLPALVWRQLAPLALPYLKGPILCPGASDMVVLEALAQVPNIGFPNLATAIANFAAHAELNFGSQFDVETASDQIRAYLLGLGAVVHPQSAADGAPVNVRFIRLQDGLTRWIDFANSFGRARFQLDVQGMLTLLEFSRAASA